MERELRKWWMYILKTAEQHAFMKIGLASAACFVIFQFGKDVGEAFYYILHG